MIARKPEWPEVSIAVPKNSTYSVSEAWRTHIEPIKPPALTNSHWRSEAGRMWPGYFALRSWCTFRKAAFTSNGPLASANHKIMQNINEFQQWPTILKTLHRCGDYSRKTKQFYHFSAKKTQKSTAWWFGKIAVETGYLYQNYLQTDRGLPMSDKQIFVVARCSPITICHIGCFSTTRMPPRLLTGSCLIHFCSHDDATTLNALQAKDTLYKFTHQNWHSCQKVRSVIII